MLWRLPAPVRALLVSNCPPTPRCYYSSAAKLPDADAGAGVGADALRILFCGSDDFSSTSLRALHHAKHTVPGLIEDIHVAHRPAKPTGRGLKTLREVPLSNTARDLSLPTHILDSFTGWTPPFSYNLIIAVSFGLLVPPRILNLAHYGGLNVHPSLLPDLRGSAPIEHAILKGRSHTGVSVQTLHPRRFDEGLVLAATAPPGIAIAPRETAGELRGRLATIGADMLVDVLRARKYIPPLTLNPDLDLDLDHHVSWYTGPTELAPKITKQDRFVDFHTRSLRQIGAVQRALGDMWCLLPNRDRLVIHKVSEPDHIPTTPSAHAHAHRGLFAGEAQGELLFRAACGRVGAVWASTYAGGAARKGNSKVLKMLREQPKL